MSDTVRVQARDLHRLLLEFRIQLERGGRPVGYRGGWHHGVDYDRSFERLADIIDAWLTAGGEKADPRTRCRHSRVYEWPADPEPLAWIDVSPGSVAGDVGPRLRHLAAPAGLRAGNHTSYTTLCGFTFIDEDIASAECRRCGVCVREQQLRGISVTTPARPAAARPSFRQWLRRFRREESAIGDLARDALADQDWPRGPGSLTRYAEHLEDVGALDRAIGTLREAWDRYEHERGAR